METKIYVCPECGRKYGDLTKVQSCISNHLADAERIRKEAEKAKAEQEIKNLQAQNKQLINQIQSNCEKLNSLGVQASITYIEGLEKLDRKTNINTSKNFDEQLKKIDEELEKAKEKLSPKERQIADDFEKALAAILGI